jgi:hypothetical protein
MIFAPFGGKKMPRVRGATDSSADWTGLEPDCVYASNAMSWGGGDWVVTELRPGERAEVKLPICRFVCWFIS